MVVLYGSILVASLLLTALWNYATDFKPIEQERTEPYHYPVIIPPIF